VNWLSCKLEIVHLFRKLATESGSRVVKIMAMWLSAHGSKKQELRTTIESGSHFRKFWRYVNANLSSFAAVSQ